MPPTGWGRGDAGMIPLRTETQAVSDTGLVREVNEDRFHDGSGYGIWAVADGMGGMARGDWASTAVIDAIAALPPVEDFDTAIIAVAESIRAANAVILAESTARGKQMGTTIVALVVLDRKFGVLWTGDSRVYLLRSGQLHRLTRDHSQVQELVDSGLITQDAAAMHPLRNVLTRAVGISDPVEIDLVSDTVLAGDVFLLCSDGLYGCIPDEEIADYLRRIEQDGTAASMVAKCLERGAPDNVTLVTVMASEPTLLRFKMAEAAR